MPGIIPKSKWLWASIVVLAATTIMMVSANIASAYPNAFRYHNDDNNINGAKASIETDNPDTGSGWAYHRTFVQEVTSSGHTLYAEIGWVKGYSQATSAPKVYATWRTSSLQKREKFGSTLSSGSTYQYKVNHQTGNAWSFYFNSMSSAFIIRNLGWTTGDRAAAGGETLNTSTDMGDSDYSEVTYRENGNTSWYSVASPLEHNPHDTIYEILDGASDNDWRVKDAGS